MSDYRRILLPGGSFFFTVVTYRRRPILAERGAAERFREAYRAVKRKRPFVTDAIVILPDHIHCIWRLPPEEADFATRWRLIKHHFSRGVAAPRTDREEKTLWQRRYWEHTIRDDEDWRRHVDYIHYNPVKHGYVARPLDWAHGSFRRAVADGFYAPDWGEVEPATIAALEVE